MKEQEATSTNAVASKETSPLPIHKESKEFNEIESIPFKTLDESEPINIESSLNRGFLATLKDFNLEKFEYNHYGHKSSMDSKELSTIAKEASKSEVENIKSPMKQDIKKIEVKKLTSSDLTKDLDAKKINDIVEQKIKQFNSFSDASLTEGDLNYFKNGIIQEMIRLKCEEEKTKHYSNRNEYMATLLELLKLSNSMNMDPNLIPVLLLGGTDIHDLTEKLKSLTDDPHDILDELNNLLKDAIPQIHELLNLKKNSDTSLPSFSEATEGIKFTSLNSPVRSPQSPNTLHKRVHSDGSVGMESNSSIQRESTRAVPVSNFSPQIQSQITHNGYPVYYTHGSSSNAPLPPLNNQAKEGHNSSFLGSPYSQKYQPVMYQAARGAYQGAGTNYAPQHSYQFFVPSPPNSGQFMIQGLPPQGMTTQLPTMHFQPPEQEQGRRFMSNNTTNFKYNHHEREEITPNKKLKYSSKNSNINFMISTPKNPPARKYNTHQSNK